MGIYLNSKTAYHLFKIDTEQPYFVDKTQILEEIIPLVENGGSQVCITRPRRFGKTVMANLISSFFSRGCNAEDIFGKLQISKYVDYQQYMNKYPVIHITFNKQPRRCTSYREYIDRIEGLLIKDIRAAYPDVEVDEAEAVWDILLTINDRDDSAKFIFILDEWDYIFHQSFVTEEDKQAYLSFLQNLLKDMPYVIFTYMTGILPIAKYSSGSELNMFLEYTMAAEEKFSQYFGFTEQEADMLFERYLTSTVKPNLTREGLRYWYDGYWTKSGNRLYNPRSVVASLKNNNFGNYWTSSGPYDEIFYYIEHNVAAVRDDLALMAAGMSVPVRILEYAATSMSLQTKEEIFSAMVVYGFLSYKNGKVCIPNKELMEKFSDMLQKEPSLGYVYSLANESARMLEATLAGDTETMAQILELAHDTEVPLLSYNNEIELTAVVNLVYLAARDNYRVEREDKVGKGYVDFIFYPETDRGADCIVLELKIDSTPEDAIRQIKDRNYAQRFKGKIGEQDKYTGRILAVGISYDKSRKQHSCQVEVLS
ncbi:ATP-binding protein [Blautia schinkii]|nr:ATP-binding protein [Blautia schinkii]